MKKDIRVFSKDSSIKEDVLIDEEGNSFICMEVGTMRYCTTLNSSHSALSNKTFISSEKKNYTK